MRKWQTMKINIKFLICGIFRFIPELTNLNSQLDFNSKIVLGMTLVMIFLWVTEAIPNSITAFIPIIISPILIDISLKKYIIKICQPCGFSIVRWVLVSIWF